MRMSRVHVLVLVHAREPLSRHAHTHIYICPHTPLGQAAERQWTRSLSTLRCMPAFATLDATQLEVLGSGDGVGGGAEGGLGVAAAGDGRDQARSAA